LAVILIFIGSKMLIVDFFKIPVAVSLGVVSGTLLLSMVASLLMKSKSEAGSSG